MAVKAVLAGLTVMIVEAHEDSREMYAEAMRAAGAFVIATETGDSALAALGEAKIDILVSAIGLEGIDGVELLRRMRERGRSMKAIALTGRVFEHEVEEVMAAGFSAHVAKPCEPQALVERVREIARA